MPVLKEDGTIAFASTAEFLTEYHENIINNSLMVETASQWPLQVRSTFTIEVHPLERGVSIAAEVLYVADGQAGLEITADVHTFGALARLMAELLTLESTPPPRPAEQQGGAAEQQQAYQPPRSKHPTMPIYLDRGSAAISETQTLQTVSAREQPTPKRQVPAISLEGQLLVSNDLKNYEDMRPVDLTPEHLKSIRLPQLLATVAKAQVPISLTLNTEEGEVVLRFNMRGNLVKLTVPGGEKDLLTRFMRDGHLTKELLTEVNEMVDESRTAEEILLYRKIIRPHDYWLTIRAQTIDFLMDVHRAGTTTFRIRSEMVKRRTGIPFGSLIIPWMEVAMRNLPTDEVENHLEASWFSFPALDDESPWALQSLDVDTRTLRFLEKSLTGRDPLVHVRKTSPLGAMRTKRLFCTMMGIGLIVLTEKPSLVDAGDTPESKIAAELERRRKADLFVQVGVHWSAHPGAFKKSIEDIKKEYGANSKWDRFFPETREACHAIIALAESAAAQLRSSSKRKEYRAEKVSEFQLQVSAYHFFQQAEIAVLREAYTDARDLLEMAVEMDPKREYRALLSHIANRY